ncbi:MAG: LPXTG cell wall anchor domain-containing protein, partial [Eubacteriales bacterium]|nr:LPXTG cell wall anchor domain-containing protein [Eubacteriales bacterium]
SISDTIPFRAATANETWIKIKAQPAGDKVNVTVWTDSDPASGGVPLPDGTNGAPFSKPPVFTTVLHERAGNPSGIFDPDAYNNQTRYSLKDGAETLPYGGGDLLIKTNGASERVVSVSIDGVMVERGFVTIGTDGSITIAEAFLQTLSDGTHRLRVQYTNGYLETTLVKNARIALQPVAAIPATGGSASAPIALLAAAVALFLAVLILKRRK